MRAAREFGKGIRIVECCTREGDIVFDVNGTDSPVRILENGRREKGGKGGVFANPVAEDVALVLHTSGMTGRPKCVKRCLPLTFRQHHDQWLTAKDAGSSDAWKYMRFCW